MVDQGLFEPQIFIHNKVDVAVEVFLNAFAVVFTLLKLLFYGQQEGNVLGCEGDLGGRLPR